MKKQNQQSAKKSKLTQNQHVVPHSNQKDEDTEKKKYKHYYYYYSYLY
jgi:hypothetical protein